MKKILLFTVLSLGALAASCSKNEPGTMPGNDAEPAVTIFTYEPGEGYNTDNDLKVRISANNATKQAFMIVETEEEREAELAKGEASYIEHVKKDGFEFDPKSDLDSVVTGMAGQCYITAIAVNGSKANAKNVDFYGLKWNDLCTGTYTSRFKGAVDNVKLQQRDDDKSIYRFVDPYKTGVNLIFEKLEGQLEDEGGKYCNISITETDTGAVLSSYGSVFVSDLASFAGEASYKSYTYFYENYAMYAYVYYYVAQTYLTSGYDKFIPNE